MKCKFRSLVSFVAVLLVASAGAEEAPRTLVLQSGSALSSEQQAALQSYVENARTRCHTASSSLVVALDLVVSEAYPTTGISPTEVVAVFLRSRGVQPSGIKQGQVVRPLSTSEIAGSTVQLAFSCHTEP